MRFFPWRFSLIGSIACLLFFLLPPPSYANNWTSTTAMRIVRQNHTLSLLSSDKVLAVGHETGNRTSELFDPTTSLWSLSGTTNFGRKYHTAEVIKINGSEKVIVTGGVINISSITNTIEIFDVNTEIWTLGSNMNTPRAVHESIVLKNGNILVIGGETTGFASSNKVEEYNPNTNTWVQKSSMVEGRINLSAILLHDGRVFVAGGANNQSTEIYDPSTDVWIKGPDTITPHASVTTTLLNNGKVLIVGGFPNMSELFDPITNTITTASSTNFIHTEHTATLLNNGNVLITGSSNSNGRNKAEIFNSSTNSWDTIDDLIVGRSRHAAVLLQNGTVLVTGGQNGPNTLRDAEIYTPSAPPGPTPFLRLPWKYEDKGLSFTSAAMTINSYFDHTYPFLSTNLAEPNEFINQITTFTGETPNKPYSRHDGYDYGRRAQAFINEPMVAAADGVATYKNDCGPCGNAIHITHENGFQTRYYHLQKTGLITNTPGQEIPVTKGQKIGEIGSTGNSTGAHIHFMVIEDRDDDGNFNNNIPDGLVDPYGWQGTDEDPWETYIFDYLGVSRTGNRSYYLWDTTLDGKKDSVPTAGKTVSNEKYKFIFDSNSFATNFNFSLKPLPISDPSDDLISAGYVIDAQATDSLNNIITEFLKSFTIEISFSDLDLFNIDPDTLSIYSSVDGETWLKEETTLDLENKKASTTINHLTQFALMGEKLDGSAASTSAVLTGDQGSLNFYRSDVTVTLNAIDNENGLGVDYILYNLDDSEWVTYEQPLLVTGEGEHTIQFYSADKAENLEEVKSTTFTIDKTLPEMELSYDLDAQKLQVKGIDDQPDPTFTKQKISLLKNNYIVTDKAGNKVTLKTSGVEIGKQVLLSLDSLQYNTATPSALTKHALAITYANKKDQIAHFNQYFQVQNDKKIDLLYIPKTNQTKIVSISGKGNKVTETKDGIYLLNLKTKIGKIEYTTTPQP